MGVKIQKPSDPGHPGGNRRIYVRVNHQGHRKTRVFNSSKAAESYASQVEALLKLGKVGDVFAAPVAPVAPPPAPTFAEAAQWWQDVDGAAWKGNTADTYLDALRRHALPTFAARALTDISRAEVESWWAGVCRHGYSRKHLSTIRAVLTAVLRRAVARGVLPSNPADAIAGRSGREDREVRQAEWLSEPELARFLAEAQRREPRYYPILLTIASTGLRLGEALGLQVGDVDLERGKLYVRRAVRKHRIGSPKSGKPRTVDVPSATVAILRDWLATVRAEAAVRGEEPRWVFPTATGHVDGGRHLRAAMRRALKAAGITRHLRLHDLRHTYASLALQRGVRLEVVSRQLGHKGIAITFDVYGHLAPDATREAAEAWQAILTAPGRNPGATSGTEAG